MKSKILFSGYTLDVGGIETALVNLLNELIKKYDITLLLEKKQGIFLENLNPNIKVIEYCPNQNKNVLIRKIVNLVKRIKFILRYKNKFKFAASFTTYSKMGSFCARIASKNNALWVRTDYFSLYNGNKKEMVKFFNFISYNKFKRIILISNSAREKFELVFPKEKNKLIVLNNLIDYKDIIKKSKEKIEINKKEDIRVFLNVARHDEPSKRITRLIEAAEMLKKDNERFKVILIGEGKDSKMYKTLVGEKGLTKEIVFLGLKKNPYPYFKMADCFILTSEYEGYPVVFNEAKVLNLPIITTDVSDSKIDIKNKYGIVVDKNKESIYEGMKSFIHNGYNIKSEFNAQNFNNNILHRLEKIINGGSNG